jgi:hypothetical protein
VTSRFATVKELINPGWVRHPSVPPLEAGLRPNDKLDEASVIAGDFEVDDLVVSAEGQVALSRGNEIHLLDGLTPRLVATLDGEVTALAFSRQGLVAAVRDTGIVLVQRDGTWTVLHDDARLRHCVTAICSVGDDELAVTVGSARLGIDQWRQAVVDGDRTGSVLVVGRQGIGVVCDKLGWPSGVARRDEGELLVSVANEYRLDTMPASGGARRALLRNLAAYPGRISQQGDEWLVSFPFVRNRLSEMLLDDPEFVADMVNTIRPEEWLLPTLRIENPYRSALQLGQLRVLGVLKPWAPARSYGLVGVLERSGRFGSSAHSRVHGRQHGVTAAARIAEGTLVAVRGSRALVLLEEGI